MFLKGAAISTYLDPNAALITINNQPADSTRQENRTATFTVATTVNSPYATAASYQWQQAAPGSATFADIAGATGAPFTTPLLALANTGAKYRVVASVPPLSVTSAATTLPVVPDTFAPRIEVGWLESTLFLNRGDHLEVRVLPLAAQVAPTFAVAAGDADGDGHKDVFLSQNFFGLDLDTSRSDAGLGLWLRGNGRGDFSAVPGQDAGVRIHGEQRGSALADDDGDGRIDTAVAQNRAATRLFHNIGARPGPRVHLVGPPGNPMALNAGVRLGAGCRPWRQPPRRPSAPLNARAS